MESIINIEEMVKYLDSIEYNKIVFNTFQLPESDFFKYYSQVVVDHLADNPDLFDELKLAINRRIEWLRGMHPIDYTQQYWSVDEDGNKTLIPLRKLYEEFDDVSYPLPSELGIRRKINKSFFDEQIRIIKEIEKQKNLDIIKHRLEALIKSEQEKKISDMQFDKSPKTFSTEYTHERLKPIRQGLIKEKIIGNISEEDFQYLFTAKPITDKMKRIEWGRFMAFGHSFLARTVYHEDNFDFKQVNKCIKFPKGKILDSCHKSKAQYESKKTKILDKILDV